MRHAQEPMLETVDALLARAQKCPDPKAKREYLEHLSTQYMEIFIQGQREHVPGFLGYALSRRLPRYWAAPMGDVIRNMFLCPFLSVPEQQMLAGAFYRACYRCLAGRTEAPDGVLDAEIRALHQ